MQARRARQAAINADEHAVETAQVTMSPFVALCATVHPPCFHLSFTAFLPLYFQGEHNINAVHTTQVHFLCIMSAFAFYVPVGCSCCTNRPCCHCFLASHYLLRFCLQGRDHDADDEEVNYVTAVCDTGIHEPHEQVYYVDPACVTGAASYSPAHEPRDRVTYAPVYVTHCLCPACASCFSPSDVDDAVQDPVVQHDTNVGNISEQLHAHPSRICVCPACGASYQHAFRTFQRAYMVQVDVTSHRQAHRRELRLLAYRPIPTPPLSPRSS